MIVGVLAQDQVMGYELMIPGLVFGMATLATSERAGHEPPGLAAQAPEYEVRICGQSPSISTVADWGMMEIRAPYGLDDLAQADLVIIPGAHRFLEEPDPQVISAIRAAAGNGARVASVCVGALPWRPRVCWTGAVPPRIGSGPTSWRGVTRRSRSTPRCCSSTRAPF